MIDVLFDVCAGTDIPDNASNVDNNIFLMTLEDRDSVLVSVCLSDDLLTNHLTLSLSWCKITHIIITYTYPHYGFIYRNYGFMPTAYLYSTCITSIILRKFNDFL